VVAGAGGSFCSGLDLTQVAAGNGAAQLEALAGVYRELLLTPVPTVVLARGHAIGGGVGLLAGGRLVVGSADLRVRIPTGNLAALASIVVPLCQLKARGRLPAGGDWLGSDLDAAEARRLGLVDQVVSPDQMGRLLGEARHGLLPPAWLDPVERDPDTVAAALAGVERVLLRS